MRHQNVLKVEAKSQDRSVYDFLGISVNCQVCPPKNHKKVNKEVQWRLSRCWRSKNSFVIIYGFIWFSGQCTWPCAQRFSRRKCSIKTCGHLLNCSSDTPSGRIQCQKHWKRLPKSETTSLHSMIVTLLSFVQETWWRPWSRPGWHPGDLSGQTVL
jgi:hypothetical protein